MLWSSGHLYLIVINNLLAVERNKSKKKATPVGDHNGSLCM